MKKNAFFTSALSACLLVLASISQSDNLPAIQKTLKLEEARNTESVVSRYFYIYDNLLTPAYKTGGAEADAFFKDAIKELTKLIETYKEKRDMPTVCLAQFQIAEAYMKMGDAKGAKDAYNKCIGYAGYIEQIKGRGAYTILAVTEEAKKKLESLK